MIKSEAQKAYTYFVATITIAFLSTLLTHSAIASINEAFTYQGKIVNEDGTNITNSDASCISTGGADSCDLRISLYTAVSGGTLVWQETKSDIELYDTNGIFTLVLNCGGTFSSCNQNGGPDFTSGQLYIEVEFDPNGNGDFAEGETFDPRRELTAVPYSFNAKSADSADTLDDIDSTSFLRSDTDDTLDVGYTLGIDGTIDVNGSIEIDGNITISDEALVFDGASTEFTLAGDLSINTNDLFVRKSDGYVGIGTTDPNSALEVVGNVTLGDQSWLGLDSNAARFEFYNDTNDKIAIMNALLGIGTTNPGARIDIVDSSGQLRLSYDANNYTDLSTDGSGFLTIATNGTNNYFFGIDPNNSSYSNLWAGGVIPDSTNYAMQTRNDGQEIWWNVADGGYMIFTIDNASSPAPLLIKDNSVGIGYDYDALIPVLFSVAGDAYIEGSLGIGTTGPTAYIDLPASDSGSASARIRSGTAPSSPNEGDVYADGTDMYYRSNSGWIALTAVATLQDSYEGGNSISVTSTEGALSFDAVSANIDFEIGEGTDTGDFRIWDGTNNWFLLDEGTSSISLGNTDAATALSLASGSNWSISSAGAVEGISTLTSSGDWTWSATTPTIAINSGETLTISDGTDSFTVNATASSFGMSDGSNAFSFDLDTGPSYTGTARPTKKITLSPEYPGAVLTPFYGAGTDTSLTGTMTSDAETVPASNIRSYYSWERGASGQHFYTVAVRVTLPEDFSAWTTSNALVVNYITESATSTNSSVDIRVYLEGSGTVDASDLTNTSTSWTSASFSSSDLDLWNAAGETAVIYLRLGSASGYFARIGDIELNYLDSF